MVANFDSNRKVDQNGYMEVHKCILTGEDVASYWGYEVPGYQSLGIDPKKVYRVYRPLDEIIDANFTNRPLLSEHKDFSAKQYNNAFVCGTVGETNITDGGMLEGVVVFWSENAINELKDGKRYLSCGYLYTPILEPGVYNGMPYDIKMSKIVANHVAMVDDPRFKKAIVADKQIDNREPIVMPKTVENKFYGNKTLTFDEAFNELKRIAKDADMSEEEKEKEAEKVKDCIKDKKAMDKKAMDKKGMDKRDDDMPAEPGEPMTEDDDRDDDKDDKEKNKPAMDWDSIIEKKVTGRVEKEVQKFKQTQIAKDEAIRQYERICGRINPMTFDSAGSVLDKILINKGFSGEGKTLEQKQSMVEMLPALQSLNQPTKKMAMDSKPAGTPGLSPSITKFLERN